MCSVLSRHTTGGLNSMLQDLSSFFASNGLINPSFKNAFNRGRFLILLILSAWHTVGAGRW